MIVTHTFLINNLKKSKIFFISINMQDLRIKNNIIHINNKLLIKIKFFLCFKRFLIHIHVATRENSLRTCQKLSFPNLPDVPFVVMKLERISQDISIAHGSLDKRSFFIRRGSTALEASSSPGQGCFPPTLLPRRISTFFFIIHIMLPAHGVLSSLLHLTSPCSPRESKMRHRCGSAQA